MENRNVAENIAAGRGGKTAPPTLKTIAALAGLAVPTVSRALSDAPDIGARTKEKVRRIAAEIGYVPNRAGLRLRTGRTNVIALVLPTDNDIMNHAAKMISAIAGGLRGTRFNLNVTPFFPDEDALKPVRHIVETGAADAMILNRILPQDPRVAYLLGRGFPFVTHGRTEWTDRHAWFDFDNTAYGREAMRALVVRGRRNVLMIAPPMAQAYAQHMTQGALAETPPDVRLRFSGDVTSESPRDVMLDGIGRLLRADPGIDGIICGSPTTVMVAVAAAEGLGRVVGRDIDFVGKETVPFLAHYRPQIIAFPEDVGRAGDFMARAAMQAIADPGAPPMQGMEVPTAPVP